MRVRASEALKTTAAVKPVGQKILIIGKLSVVLSSFFFFFFLLVFSNGFLFISGEIDSGKTTLVKNIKARYDTPDPETDVMEWVDILRRNTINSMQVLCKGLVEDLEPPIDIVDPLVMVSASFVKD